MSREQLLSAISVSWFQDAHLRSTSDQDHIVGSDKGESRTFGGYGCISSVSRNY